MPATLQGPGEQLPLHDTMGVMLLGTIISAMLYGASVLQTVYYFVRYPHDGRSIKSLVMVAFGLDTAHMASIMHSMYYYLISNYYDHNMLQKLVWSVIVESIFTGITAALVQFFYVWRVWLMSGRRVVLTVVIAFLILATSACGTAWVILALRMETYRDLLTITPLTITINALSTAVDVLISGSLVIFLSLSRTGFTQTDTVIARLIMFFINTGLITSLCAVGAMITLVVQPHSLTYAFFYFCIGRLYVNSLMACLNARRDLRTGREYRAADDGIGLATIQTEFSSAPAEFCQCRGEDSSHKLTYQIDGTTSSGQDDLEKGSNSRFPGDSLSGER